MTEFESAILEELRQFSAELFEPGLATGRRTQRSMPGAKSTGLVLHYVDVLRRMLASLIRDCQSEDIFARGVDVETPSPLRGTLLRSPGAYELRGGSLVPKRWGRRVPAPRIDVEPLRWLLYLARRLGDDLALSLERYRVWVEEALRARSGDSKYATIDREALREMVRRLESASARLKQIEGQILRVAGQRVKPSARIPVSTPRTTAWQRVLREFLPFVNPVYGLSGFVHTLLSEPIESADLPFLYQRWCGTKLVETMGALGWRTMNDPVGALFLGGCISFQKGSRAVALWIEPRILSDSSHECGLRCSGTREVSPDYVLVVPTDRTQFVVTLDVTMSASREVLRDKTKYLRLLVNADVSLIAGVAVHAPPIRSWAAAPQPLKYCQLWESEQPGTKGLVPMYPPAYRREPLQAWLSDVLN